MNKSLAIGIKQLHAQLSQLFGSDQFEKPISESEILEAERSIGRQLPEDWRIALTVFNGTNFPAELSLCGDVSPASFVGIFPVEQWREITDEFKASLQLWTAEFLTDPPTVIGEVEAVGFHPDWVLFSYGHGFYWFLDFAPKVGGASGQIITFYPMPQEHRIEVMARDLQTFLDRLLESSCDDQDAK